MLEDSDCLILDEPTNHLDVAARDAVEVALKEFKGTIIAVTHDRYFLTHCVEKIFEIENGQLTVYAGNYDFFKQVKYGIDEEVLGENNSPPNEKYNKPANKNHHPKNNNYHKKNNCNQPENPDKTRQTIIAQIEAEIADLEAKIKEMESLFDQATPLEKYQEYDQLLKEIERQYSNWSDLIN